MEERCLRRIEEQQRRVTKWVWRVLVVVLGVTALFYSEIMPNERDEAIHLPFDYSEFVIEEKSRRNPCAEKTGIFSLTASLQDGSNQDHFVEKKHENSLWNVWYPPNLIQHEEGSAQVIPRLNASKGPQRFVELGCFRITFLTSQMIRMEWSQEGQFADRASLVFSERENFLLNPLNTPPVVTIFDDGSEGNIVHIQSQHIHIQYGTSQKGMRYIDHPPLNSKTLHIAMYDDEGNMVSEWKPGASHNDNLGGIAYYTHPKERDIPLEPGLLSRGNWTFIDDSQTPLLNKKSNQQSNLSTWIQERKNTNRSVDWYFLAYGFNYRRCLNDFTRIAGKIPLIPQYALGVWWSGQGKYSDDHIDRLVAEYERNGIPLDVILLHNDWHILDRNVMESGALDKAGKPIGQTGYSWNYSSFPCPRDFIASLRQKGLMVSLLLHPESGIQAHEYSYLEMAKAMKIDPLTADYIPFDVLDRDFMDKYFTLVIEPLERDGVEFWWLDYYQLALNGSLVNPTFWLTHCFFNSGNHEHNRTKSEPRKIVFHRWGGLGSHRYPIGFSLDTTSNWKSLASQVFVAINAANVGFSFVSYDIGGSESKFPHRPELLTRWVQWGALSPIFRTHIWKENFYERRPWKYPEYYASIMKEAIHFRYSLVPYLYTESRRSFDSGVSLLYPLYYDYPFAEESYRYKTQGLLGENLLIAPVTSGLDADNYLSKVEVFLPGNSTEWIEWSTLTSLSSGVYTRNIALDQIPVYVRAGSIIPMMKVDDSVLHLTSESLTNSVVLSVFPGSKGISGEYNLYEDDGYSQDYLSPLLSSAWTLITSHSMHNSTHKLWKIQVNPTEGSFEGMSESRSFVIRLVGMPPPLRICNTNGDEIQFVSQDIQSREKMSFTHWSMSRDRNRAQNVSLFEWYYDYEHFTVVVRTSLVPRSESMSVIMEWDQLMSNNWESMVNLLHQGWIGAFNTVHRINAYASYGLSNITNDCLKLLDNLVLTHPHRWSNSFALFREDYKRMTTLIGALPPQTSPRADALVTIFINHLRRSLLNLNNQT